MPAWIVRRLLISESKLLSDIGYETTIKRWNCLKILHLKETSFEKGGKKDEPSKLITIGNIISLVCGDT